MDSFEFDPVDNDLNPPEPSMPELPMTDNNSTFPMENGSLMNSSINSDMFNNGLGFNDPSVTNNDLLTETNDSFLNQDSSLNSPTFGASNGCACQPLSSNDGHSFESNGTNSTHGYYPYPDNSPGPWERPGTIHRESVSFGSNNAIDSAEQIHSDEGSGIPESTQHQNDSADGKDGVHFGSLGSAHYRICHNCGHVWWGPSDYNACPRCGGTISTSTDIN